MITLLANIVYGHASTGTLRTNLITPVCSPCILDHPVFAAHYLNFRDDSCIMHRLDSEMTQNCRVEAYAKQTHAVLSEDQL
jgi:hypothetical protein